MSTGPTSRGQKKGQKFKLPTRRAIHQAAVTSAAASFERSRNPVFAWDAIAECLAARLPFPPTIREYLQSTSASMTRLSRKSIPRKGQVDRAIAGALGFKRRGRKNPFRVFAQYTHEYMVAFDVYTAHTKNWGNHRQGVAPTHDWNSVFCDVAAAHSCLGCPPSAKKRRLSAATVKRFWYQHAMDVIPPHLIDRSPSKKIDDILR